MAIKSATADLPKIKGLVVEKIDHLDEPMRGRGFDDDVLAVREQLEASLEDGQGRTFNVEGVDEPGRKSLENLVRRAGNIKPVIKVSVRSNKRANKITWGPKETMDKLQVG
jgi:hypothetical protein